MSETPSGKDWSAIALVILAAFTAFITAWNAFNGNDATQNDRLGRIERVLCATDEEARNDACRVEGVKPT
jgi:hypothetical protein